MTIKSIILIPIFLLIHITLSAQVPGTKKWEFSATDDVNSMPSIGMDGTIYVGSDDNKLYALNPDGTKKWEFLTIGPVASSPAIGFDGTIFVTSTPNKIYAINPNGTKKWEFSTGSSIYSSPAIGIDGTIYVGSWDKKLYAIRTDGTKKWEFVTGDKVSSSPAIGHDGTIYVGSWDNKLYAINPDATKKWEFSTGSDVSSSPALGIDKTIYVGSKDKKLYAINPNGTKKWEFLTGGEIESSPAISGNETIYVGSSDNKLYAINSDGTKKWEFSTGDDVFSSPAIGKDGTIFVGSYDSKLYALNPDGTKKWEFVTGMWIQSSPAIGTDGTIYTGSWDNKLYAVYSNCGGLANSAWPKFRYNLANDGNKATGIYCSNNFFAFIPDPGTESFKLVFNKNRNLSVTITKIEFNNKDFQYNLSLPHNLNADVTNFNLPVTLSTINSALYESGYEITYTIGERTFNLTDSLEIAIIKNNNSELSVVGKRAIDAYYVSLDSNRIAVSNNKGVIYRLVGEYEKAEEQFNIAVNLALNSFYGFTGIKMNQGVVKSDKLNSTNAMSIYTSALEDLPLPDSSVIAPQIFYNQAWEHYRLKAFAESKAKALMTINHKKSNSFLKAKAYVLLGADDAALKDTLAAIAGFQNAIYLDPSSCIADIARENIRLLTTTDIFSIRAESFSIYPNPNNRDFQILFRDNIVWPVIIRVYNQIGIQVYEKEFSGAEMTLKIDLPAGIPGGLYFIEAQSGGRKTLNKMVIL